MRLLIPAVLTASLCAGCLRSDATAPTQQAEQSATTKATAAAQPAPKAKSAAPEQVVRLVHLKDRSPWEEYLANPAAADLKFKGKLVEFVMNAEVQSVAGERYALVNWMRHNLNRDGDRPMHVVVLRPEQVEKVTRLKKDDVVTVRARVDPGGAQGKVVALGDGELVAVMQWDAKSRAYVPE
jgi:hypothetical protein